MTEYSFADRIFSFTLPQDLPQFEEAAGLILFCLATLWLFLIILLSVVAILERRVDLKAPGNWKEEKNVEISDLSGCHSCRIWSIICRPSTAAESTKV
jgi:predicted MPP superfamily phosphohydrolase